MKSLLAGLTMMLRFIAGHVLFARGAQISSGSSDEMGYRGQAEKPADELKKQLDGGSTVMIIDVRSPASFEKETIPGSINIPLAELEGYLKKMSTDTFMGGALPCARFKNQPCQPGVDRSVNRYAEIYDRRPDSIDRNFP